MTALCKYLVGRHPEECDTCQSLNQGCIVRPDGLKGRKVKSQLHTKKN